MTHAPALAEVLWTVIKQDGASWLEGLKLTGEFGDDDEEL